MSSINPTSSITDPLRKSASNSSYITRSSSSPTSLTQKTNSSAEEILAPKTHIPSGGKYARLRPKRTLSKITNNLSSQETQKQNSQEASQNSIPASPFNFLRPSTSSNPVGEDSASNKRVKRNNPTPVPVSQETFTSLTKTNSSSSSVNTQTLIDEINAGNAITEFINAENIYQFLLEVGEKITYLNLSKLDKKVKIGSTELTEIIVKITSLKNLKNLRGIEITVLRGDLGEQAGQAFSTFFEFTPHLDKFICSGNAQSTSDFITPVIHGLKHLSHLSQLTLEELTDQDLTLLTSQFPIRSKLTELKILSSSISDVKVLANQLSTLSSLRKFTLEIKEADKVKHLSQLTKNAFSPPNMEEFELRISKNS